MFDVKRRAWSGEILEALELDENLLPNVLSSEQVDDLVLASVAAELGIERVPVVAGAGDQGTGALGNSLVNTGEAFITVGTGGQVLTSLEEPLIDSAGRLQTLCHVFPFGVGSGWYSLKPKGHIEVFGIKRFGVSGSGSDVAKHLGFTVEALTQRMLDMINN
jgi:sugar (pentulose or hexulose) kinase